ncbi:hypothetical protein J45TS6_01470 [Paenibacillus sp. J45TS6]|uniref:DUF5359 family protein n=1 Tax=Paenibacillus sp. J45TS6 TaxID=2807196 RepID=UPI001B1FFA78|nr:DUF5359 family protein [Paenibacillus sp. J45TS6]GIP41688.1 hypothetical protein J45TS6_01470 [Paenibacillus sp. J45TS6]
MKQSGEEARRYEAIFIKFSTQVERRLKKLLLCLFLLLLVFQVLLHNRYTAPHMSAVFRLEGTPLPASFQLPNMLNKE